MYGMTKAEETEHLQKLSTWLRGEAGRHMASMRVAKGAPKDSHALHLLLWADLVDQVIALEQNVRKEIVESIRLHTSAWSNLPPDQAKAFSEFLIRQIEQ